MRSAVPVPVPRGRPSSMPQFRSLPPRFSIRSVWVVVWLVSCEALRLAGVTSMIGSPGTTIALKSAMTVQSAVTAAVV